MISIFFLKRLIFTCVSLSHTLVLQVKVKVASVGCRIMLIHTRVLVRDSLIRMGGGGRGGEGGAMVLGKLPVPGRPSNFD